LWPVIPDACSVFGKTRYATVLSANTAGDATVFNAYLPKVGSARFLAALVRERAGKVSIRRFVSELGPASIFTTPEPWSTADVNPAGIPFSGSGHLAGYVSRSRRHQRRSTTQTVRPVTSAFFA
jgi:hypothetical protein